MPRDVRRAVLDDDLFAVAQRDAARILGPELAVYGDAQRTPVRCAQLGGLRAAQFHVPNVEELSQRERTRDRCLDVNDPVIAVRVDPVEAARAFRNADLSGHADRTAAVE